MVVQVIKRLLSILALLSAAALHAQINCSSGFNASGSGPCSVTNATAIGSGQLIIYGFPSPIGTTQPQVQLSPPNAGHQPVALNYYVPVNVTAFTSTFAFIPNGQNLAFVFNNTTNSPGYQGNIFLGGAGCEGGFFQADGIPPTSYPPNNVFALQVADMQDSINYPAIYTYNYSTVQMFISAIEPCLPTQGGSSPFPYVATNRISTYPVPQQASPVQFSTTGDVYVVTLTYTGSHITMQMYDQTLGYSCPSANCFTHTWPIYIPSVVSGTTAYVGLVEGNNANLPGSTWINSWTYSSLSPAAAPTFSLASGTYSGTQSLTLSDSTGGSYICYNFTGGVFSDGIGGCPNGTLYTGPISIPSGRNVYAVAAVAGAAGDSTVASVALNITGTGSIPIFNQPGEIYYNGYQTVQLTAAHGGTTCWNTTGAPATNGSTGCATGTLYTAPIPVTSNGPIYAVAGGTGLSDSAVGSVAYIVNPFWDGSSPSGQAPANSPTMSPVPGTYSGTQMVTLSTTATGSATPYICYVLSSTLPTFLPQPDNQGGCPNATLYTGPIAVSFTQNLYAMAGVSYASLPSSLVQGTFTIVLGGGSTFSGGVMAGGAIGH